MSRKYSHEEYRKMRYEQKQQRIINSMPKDYETNKRARKKWNKKYKKYVKDAPTYELYSSKDSYKKDRFNNFFGSFAPGILFIFILTMFFGGFTSGVVNSHTTIVQNPYGNTEIEDLSYFDYDFTYKLEQLSKFRNIFDLNITNDDLDYQNVLIYDSAFTYYYDHNIIYWGLPSWTDSVYQWLIVDDADADAVRVYNYRSAINIWTLSIDDSTNYLYRNFYYVDNGSLMRTELYYRVSNKQNNDWFNAFKLLGNIFFRYPFVVIYNVSYDIGILTRFIFDW